MQFALFSSSNHTSVLPLLKGMTTKFLETGFAICQITVSSLYFAVILASIKIDIGSMLLNQLKNTDLFCCFIPVQWIRIHPPARIKSHHVYHWWVGVCATVGLFVIYYFLFISKNVHHEYWALLYIMSCYSYLSPKFSLSTSELWAKFYFFT